MRTLMFLGLAASLAIVPAAAESARGTTVPTGRDWGSVPTIPLRPPVGATMPRPAPDATGNWSSGGGWRGGQGDWHRARGDAPHVMSGRSGDRGQWRGHRDMRGDRGASGRFHPRRGFFIPRFFVSPTYFVSNWGSYGLAAPADGQRWVRYYDDAVLIDDRGYIYDTAPGVDWDGYGYPVPDYDEGYHDEDAQWGPSPYVLRHPGPGVYYAPPGSTTVIIQAPSVMTTTTTTTYVDEVVHVRPKKAWRGKRALRARGKCACK